MLSMKHKNFKCQFNPAQQLTHHTIDGKYPITYGRNNTINAMVNYAHPKGCELVMLPMLPWQAYSTIGWLTDTLPSRSSECRRAAS